MLLPSGVQRRPQTKDALTGPEKLLISGCPSDYMVVIANLHLESFNFFL